LNNTSGEDGSDEVEAVCAKETKDYSSEESADYNLPAGVQQGGIFAFCPAGTKILGGGGWVAGEQIGTAGTTVYRGVNFNASFPLKADTYGWQLTINNTDTQYSEVNAFAICGKEPNYSIERGNETDNPSGATSYAVATCPAETTVLSGGVYSDSSGSPRVNINSTMMVDQGWGSWEGNGSAGDAYVLPYAICAT
jgi:hypothetical protein